MKLCYLDAFSGISGDMTVGALVDAGADATGVLATLESLAIGASCRIERTRRQGISAAKFIVEGGDRAKHRHLHHCLDIIEKSALSRRAKENASAVFRNLADAEAAVHGEPAEKVHFHEVGAVDSISDICGACAALDLLGVDALAVSPVNVGSGTAETSHGLLPVPAPATAHLLLGKPVYSRGPALELTTPTGAALAVTMARSFGVIPPMKFASVGYGAGDRDFPEHANVLRAIIGDTLEAAESAAVFVLEANIDDSTPEVLAYAMDRLLEAGALDVSFEPLFMKKGRPGSLLRVIARPEDRDTLASLILRETSSFGLRLYAAERRVQPRRHVTVQTSHGPVRVKVSSGGSFAPEFEDCKKLALEAGVPLQQVMAEASHEYLKNQ